MSSPSSAWRSSMTRPSIVEASASSSLSRWSLRRPLGLVGELLGLVLRVGDLAQRDAPRRRAPRRRGSSAATSSSSRPEPPSILICCSLPVPRSFAETLMMPFASMSNDDLDLRHAPRRRRNADELELAERLVERAISDSPCSTCTSTEGWLSSAVVNVSDFFVGIVVLRSISLVKTPPLVSMPSDSGVTSRSRMSLTSPLSTPPWIAAPTATTSSGLTPLCGSLPISSLTFSCTAGMRVMPPTRTTWSIFGLSMPASSSACLRRADRALEQVGGDLLELRARELQVEVLRAVLRRGDERQVDLRRHRRGQLDLRLLRRLVEALERHAVRREVDALVLLELRDHPVDDRLVEVVAAEVVVAVRGLDLEDALAELEDRHVERAAAEVEDEDRLVGAFLVEPVRECCGGRLVDDAHDVEARDLARVLRRLALRVVEVGRDGDRPRR